MTNLNNTKLKDNNGDFIECKGCKLFLWDSSRVSFLGTEIFHSLECRDSYLIRLVVDLNEKVVDLEAEVSYLTNKEVPYL